MKFNLLIHEGTDSIKFGMTRQEIQEILKINPVHYNEVFIPSSEEIQKMFKIKPEDFIKNKVFPSYGYDDFENVRVRYEQNETGALVCCELVFAYGVAKSKAPEVFLDGIKVLGKRKKEAIDFFKIKFDDCEIDSHGMFSSKNDFSCSIYKNKTDQVCVSRKNYPLEFNQFMNSFRIEQEKYFKENKLEPYYCSPCVETFMLVEGSTNCPTCNTPFPPDDGLRSFYCPVCDIPFVEKKGTTHCTRCNNPFPE